MDIIKFYQDFNIPYKTEGHKHCREGWVQIECPFCTGNPGLHLGYKLQSNHFSCYRCGFHSVFQVVQTLTSLGVSETKNIIRQYQGTFAKKESLKIEIKKLDFKFPTNTTDLQEQHKRYLIKRKFDPDKLSQIWGLKGTGPISTLLHKDKQIDYSHRIIIPFHWNNKIVSFDARSISKNVEQRYQACPKEREIICHKDIVYGRPDLWTKTGICVEGPTDVWRFGTHAFATSGIKFTPKQIRVIYKAFDRIAVVFDGETTAQEQARTLIKSLRDLGKDAFLVDIEGDPGDMDQAEADYLVKQLIT